MHEAQKQPFELYLETIDYMLVGIPQRRREEICRELLTHLEDAATDQGLSPTNPELQREVIETLGSSLDLGVELHQAHYARYLTPRRIFDITTTITLFLLMTPFFLIAALIIKLETPGPIFYTTEWLGQYGQRFRLYRLRTMTRMSGAEAPRFTRFGAWMRKASLDETAALINVLRGEMSFFGPRLLRPGETNLEDPRCRRILQVPPGLSSPSLVRHGFPRVDLQIQLALDEEYLNRHSLRYDFYLFWQTLRLTRRQARAK